MNPMKLKMQILFNARKCIDKLYRKIRVNVNKLYGKIWRMFYYLPLAARLRESINHLNPKVGEDLNYPHPEIGKGIHHLYLTKKGYALAFAVFIDGLILHKGKAYEEEYGRNKLFHGIGFYER